MSHGFAKRTYYTILYSLIKDHPFWVYDSYGQAMGKPEGNASMPPVVFKNLMTYSETMQGLNSSTAINTI